MSKTRRKQFDGRIAGLSALLDPEDHPHLGRDSHRLDRHTRTYLIPPDRIELEGPYVRTAEEVEAEPDFEQFAAGIAKNRTIGQPVGLRTVGRGVERRFVLVYGMRRWRAALRRPDIFEKIEAVDLGEISVEEAYQIQIVENGLRTDPPKVALALAIHRSLEMNPDLAQQELALRIGEDPGTVSFLGRVGAGIALMTPAQYQALLRAWHKKRVITKTLQQVARLPTPEARRDRLLEIVSGDGPAPGSAAAERQRTGGTIVSRSYRDGRGLTMRWRDSDLERAPGDVVRDVSRHFRTEIEVLAKRLGEMRDANGGSETSEVGKAARFAEALLKVWPQQGD